ncbi:DUF362 domain-containing protein [Natranaerofaba carboxydovora]|uniref:DUF362 domain-containing protein n=1 Tax=Natranaerofaba carboxydovora TaxID=2742683 RepID=UPI001F140A1E|nr:DUF362 domain-containing protein [Natranaerofaba carboxydovora]UMZ74522.1 hypothetical protein ACONDI_02116 [Natranaerofaba carboxydovora]
MMEKGKIYTIYGNSPKEMVKKILDQYPPKMEDLTKDARIALKPNLVKPKYSDSGATTSPEMVAGVLEFLKDKGFNNIVIMESSWVETSTEKAFDVCGYTQLSREYGIPLLNLQEHEYETVKSGSYEINVFKRPMNVDYFINLPVLKAHCQTNLTCALKNLKGCVPNDEKRRFHSLGLDEPIARLNTIIESDLVIVDGIIGDLTYEGGGNPVEMGRIMLCEDPVLLDSYAAKLLGYEIEDVGHLKIAEGLGVGEFFASDEQLVELDRDKKPKISVENSNLAEKYADYVQEDGACSPCYGSLIHALARLDDKNQLYTIKDKKICIGTGYKEKSLDGLGIGLCTKDFKKSVKGCPPDAREILKHLENE